ncbi:hypothetical protein AYK20_01910 [Thermoplasmatales archaeon SG8-52-1]|nr:MAG: hypothetical protein AYK20_01910 [Thermoplasmatales archaeon SG8-52-1]
MKETEKRFNIIEENIEFKMIRQNSNCWIKITPLKSMSVQTILHIYLNDEYYSWEIYDSDGREKHIIYFEGLGCIPTFYLNSGKNSFKVKFNMSSIDFIKIKQPIKTDILKKKYNCYSSKAACWAKDVFYTSRPDKYPFDEM